MTSRLKEVEPLLFMMHWKVNTHPSNHKDAVHKFLSTGAPIPDGCKQVGRWHAPGSGKGWLLVETLDLKTVYEHASEWSHLLTWDVTPVLTDKEAGAVSSKVWGGVKLGCGW